MHRIVKSDSRLEFLLIKYSWQTFLRNNYYNCSCPWRQSGHQGLQTGNIALLGDVTGGLRQVFKGLPFSFPVRVAVPCWIVESATSVTFSEGDGGGDG